MAPVPPLTRAQVLALRDQLLAFRERIVDGQLTASTGTLNRLDGAIVALGAVLGESTDALTELLAPED